MNKMRHVCSEALYVGLTVEDALLSKLRLWQGFKEIMHVSTEMSTHQPAYMSDTPKGRFPPDWV